MEKYDYLVIGSGPAGYVSAIRAAQLGLKVAVVEKDADMFGGVCLNEGCIPAKSLYHSAGVYAMVKNSSDLCGVEVQCGEVDLSKIVKKSREAAAQLRKGLSFLFKKNGITLINGRASFHDEKTVSVSRAEGWEIDVKADKFLVAAGSAPVSLPGMPFDEKNIITSSRGIRLDKVPRKMLVVGGGAIGTEFASFFNTIGSEVTVVEAAEALLPREDREVARSLQSIFRKKGITVHVSSLVKEAQVEDNGVRITIESSGEEVVEMFEVVLVSVGRVPSTSDLGLDKAGVVTDEAGFIEVDGCMRTSAKNVYAAGDVVRTPMLAHMAYAEGEMAAESAAGRVLKPIDYGCVPSVIFTGVQVASVGMTEEDAVKKNIEFKTGKQFFKACGRAVVNGETEGFIKIIADANTRKLLGAHIVGHEASELIHEFVIAIHAGLSVEDIERPIHAHPTFSETVVDACKAVFDRPIHG